jgi:hypothetical protein
VRRQTFGEVDVAAIEELAVGGDGYEERRVAVLGDANSGCLLLPSSRH